MNDDFKEELKDCYADLQKLNERNAEYIGTIDRLRRRVAETDVEIEQNRIDLNEYQLDVERLRDVMKTAIRQFEDGNLLSCHRTLCDAVYGKQK